MIENTENTENTENRQDNPVTTEEKKELPSRASRGKRMSNLIKEEADADDAFWGQEFFKDETNDNEFISEEVEEDVFDADFYNPENEVVEPLSDNEKNLKEKDDTKKRRAYVDPQGRGAKKHKTGGKGGKKKEAPTTEGVTAAVAAALAPPSTDGAVPDTTVVSPKLVAKEKKHMPASDRVVRTTTKDKTEETKKDQAKYKLKKQKKKAERMKRRPKHTVRMPTQDELLEEAKITEEINKASLEYLTRMEEEKKKVTTTKVTLKGPLIRFYSKGGVTTITFTDVDAFPDYINAKAPPYPAPGKEGKKVEKQSKRKQGEVDDK